MYTIGKYKELYNDESLPSIYENISDTPIKYKEKILKHLKSGKVSAVAPSYIKDVIAHKTVNETLMMMNDANMRGVLMLSIILKNTILNSQINL